MLQFKGKIKWKRENPLKPTIELRGTLRLRLHRNVSAYFSSYKVTDDTETEKAFREQKPERFFALISYQ